MMENKISQHWETIYETKTPDQVSWTQKIPSTSLKFISSLNLGKNSKIIDVGGGDSNLVDHLLDLGYTNLSVLDISRSALKRAQIRLGEKANKVNWIHSDILQFETNEKYDVWHDRAAFHFQTSKENIELYVSIANQFVSQYMIIGTFSIEGPLKCSGLEIKQYATKDLENTFSNNFKLIKAETEDHITPFETKQNFLYGLFEKN